MLIASSFKLSGGQMQKATCDITLDNELQIVLVTVSVDYLGLVLEAH